MSTVAALLHEIEEFCRFAGMSESMFGKRVANDGKFVGRLRDGADLTVGTLDRARAFIRDQRGARGDRGAVAAGASTEAASAGPGEAA